MAYVSGAALSFGEVLNQDPGADLADYTYDTIPTKVAHLVQSQLLHERLQQSLVRLGRADPKVNRDPLIPIIADADSG